MPLRKNKEMRLAVGAETSASAATSPPLVGSQSHGGLKEASRNRILGTQTIGPGHLLLGRSRVWGAELRLSIADILTLWLVLGPRDRLAARVAASYWSTMAVVAWSRQHGITGEAELPLDDFDRCRQLFFILTPSPPFYLK